MKNVCKYIIIFIISISVTVGASIKFSASNIEFISNKTEATNVQSAIEELFTKSEYDEEMFPDGKPLIPKMTSDECSVGKVTSLTPDASSRAPYKAFDKIYTFGDINVETDLENTWQTRNTSGDYLEFQFNNPVRITKVEFNASYTSSYGGVALKQAKLMASNDGENFIDLSDIKNMTNSLATVNKWNYIESNDKNTYYKYVRLFVIGSYTTSYGTGIAIREAQFYGWYK